MLGKVNKFSQSSFSRWLIDIVTIGITLTTLWILEWLYMVIHGLHGYKYL